MWKKTNTLQSVVSTAVYTVSNFDHKHPGYNIGYEKLNFSNSDNLPEMYHF